MSCFSRKQVIAPQVISLNEAVQQLQRLLGEDIELDVRLARELSPIRIDFGQLEQMLVNLCANARDAMPDGGKLIIATEYVRDEPALRALHPELPAGQLVCLSVSDCGHGIADDVREHIFEPFYTTKEVSHGTGLGLAMVYGAVQQNGGCIEVESLPERGATFRLCFPAVQEPSQPLMAAVAVEPPSGSETLVVVEDEEMVRGFAVRLLQRLGYRVLAFASGAEALQALASHSVPIDLLITDMVMPGMNGKVLAERMREHFPQLEVLFTSGYSEQLIERHGLLDAGIEFLPKPYTIRSLAEHVRRLLDKVHESRDAARRDDHPRNTT
jgi:two-component system cell cycle sensor histidine kinase/response regulator CckA